VHIAISSINPSLRGTFINSFWFACTVDQILACFVSGGRHAFGRAERFGLTAYVLLK
jgi:hypothetical protein